MADKDGRVKVLAESVHEADLHDGKFTRNEGAGADLGIKGRAGGTELRERAIAMFDGLDTAWKQEIQHHPRRKTGE